MHEKTFHGTIFGFFSLKENFFLAHFSLNFPAIFPWACFQIFFWAEFWFSQEIFFGIFKFSRRKICIFLFRERFFSCGILLFFLGSNIFLEQFASFQDVFLSRKLKIFSEECIFLGYKTTLDGWIGIY